MACLKAAAGFLCALIPASFEVDAAGRSVLLADPRYSDFHVPGPPNSALLAPLATLSVNYLPAGPGRDGDTCIAWTAPAKAAFTYAASIWASQVLSAVPIVVDACFADNLAPGVLSDVSVGNFYKNFSGALMASTWYPVALANALHGSDLDPTGADIYVALDSRTNWYYGTDGLVALGQFDFATATLHQLGHGLGFATSMDVMMVTPAVGSPFPVGSWGAGSPYPYVYDRFLEDGGTNVLVDTSTYPNPSGPLGEALLGYSFVFFGHTNSGGIFFNGANAKAANAGTRVRVQAPFAWSPSVSISDLATTYAGTAEALMTPVLSSGESIHSPGPVIRGILRDLGWTLASADVALAQVATPNPALAGKDEILTLTVTNNGPSLATEVAVTDGVPAGTSFVWASPGCALVAGSVICTLASVAVGGSASVKVVVRPASAGSITSLASVTAPQSDPASANNTSTLVVNVNATPPGTPILRYRLYSDVTKEHHFTTDLNEYNVLGTYVGTWVQEGTVGKILNNPGPFGGVESTPYYRLYDNSTRWHHWTTDPNEYYTLGYVLSGWNMEGVDGWILPTQAPGTTELYRLNYPALGSLHHWTIDLNEYTTLISTFGWIGEPGAGFVVQ